MASPPPLPRMAPVPGPAAPGTRPAPGTTGKPSVLRRAIHTAVRLWPLLGPGLSAGHPARRPATLAATLPACLAAGLAACLAVGLAANPALAQDTPCRQALALGLDVSGSVDGAEYRLQLDGLAAALSHPDVTDALLAAAGAPVSIAVYEWSGPTSQALIVDWTAITDAAALLDVTARLRANTRTPADPSTALGTAILVGGQLLAQRPACWKRTLDISGDGESNTGRRPQDLDDAPELAGITVNALVIAPETIAPPAGAQGLLGYFENYVIRGPGAFAEHAEDFAAYEAAMVRKLLKELQGLVVGEAMPEPEAATPNPEARPFPGQASR